MSDRKEELIKIVGDDPLYSNLIDEIINIENQLDEIRKLPLYKVNPNNPTQQKALPSFRIYKELLQQYTNCLKILAQVNGADNENDVSPLRKWAAKYVKNEV